MSLQLLPGDVFCVRSAGIVGLLIRAVQWFHSRDGEATYNHSGIITSPEGDILEAHWQIRQASIWQYEGKQILIGRHKALTTGRYRRAISAIKYKYLGRPYPVWRIAMHLVPFLAKFASLRRHGVCSEITAEFAYLIGARHGLWPGTTPDILADEIRTWRTWQVVHEDRLEK